MIKLWTRIFPFAILSSVYNTRYFVSGALNNSCVPNDISCSVCCAKQECITYGFYLYSCKNGCIDGHRSARCYELCNYNCKNCDDHINECKSCFDGFYPGVNKDCTSKCKPNCKECSNGYSCISCKEGFQNKNGSTDCSYRFCPTNCECSNGKCETCKPGFHDINRNCTSKCPNNCKRCSSYLQCSECKDGYFNNGNLSTCMSSCRDNCTTCSSYDKCSSCQPGTFGKQCNYICSAGCQTNECEIETGKCDCLDNFSGESCTECKSGLFGISCDRTCPKNCMNSVCGKIFGICTEGCKSKTTGSFCDTCVTGNYGPSCNETCPKNCLTDICDKENGTCIEGCNEGFDGPFCLECVQGKYGNECKEDCPDKCKDNECLKLSGHCLNCTGNFHGNICDICKPGFYGSDCELACSSKCYNDSCVKDSGKCNYGCKDAYSGDKCCVKNANCIHCESNTICQQCSPGYFGKTCNETCSDLCINKICEINTGICSQGCTGSVKEKICLRNQRKTEADSKFDSKDIAITVLACTVFVLCILILVFKIKKVYTTRSKHEDTIVLSSLESSKTDIPNTSKDDIVAPYELVAEWRSA